MLESLDLPVPDIGLPGGMKGRQIADAARTLRPGPEMLSVTGKEEKAVVGNGHLERGMHVPPPGPLGTDALAGRIKAMVAEVQEYRPPTGAARPRRHASIPGAP